MTSTNVGGGFYSGTLTLTTFFGSVNVPVTLSIVSGGNNSVVASPSTVSFVAAPGGQAGSQNVSVTVNGAPTPISGFSFTPTSGGISFITTVVNSSTATLSVNTTSLGNGVYTGVETLSTASGSVSVQVTLTVGGGTSNIVASPNPVSFNIQTGGSAPSQNVLLTLNGVQTNVQAVSATTNTGQNWLLPTVSGTSGTVNVGVNGSFLAAGSYSGTVSVSTLQGTASFQVNLTVGGTPTLQVNPTALNFAYQTGTNAPPPQTVSITSNGSPVSYTVFASVNSGPQWLIVSPLGQGQTPGTLNVSIQPAGLQAGITYTGNIQVSTFGGSSIR